jgi:hypothetical protein
MTNNKDLEKVIEKNAELVWCPKKDCKERGDYIRCYFDIYENCDLYRAEHKGLNTKYY